MSWSDEGSKCAHPGSHGSAGALSSEVLQGSERSRLAIIAAAPEHQEKGLNQLHAAHAVNVGFPQGGHAPHQGCCCIPGILLHHHHSAVISRSVSTALMPLHLAVVTYTKDGYASYATCYELGMCKESAVSPEQRALSICRSGLMPKQDLAAVLVLTILLGCCSFGFDL